MDARRAADEYGVVDERAAAPEGRAPQWRNEAELRLMARSLAGLFAAGATLTFLTTILPHPADANQLAQLVVVGDAFVIAALLYWKAGRIPGWALELVLAAGTVHITVVSYFSAQRPSPLLFFYLWVFLHASYFSSRRVVAAQIVFAGANLGLLLALREPPSGAESWWLVGMGAMLVAATLVLAMRERGEELITSLRRTANERERAQRELSLHRDNLELLVRERTAALEVAYRELESFSYSVSHDLRTPLRSLDGFSQALLEDYDGVLDEEGRDYLGRIRAASQRMARLIDGMLQLSRLARSEMKREPIDLSDLAGSVVEDLRAADPERDVEVVIEPGISAEGDNRLVRVVLENLLSNAWKFTSRQPRATIAFGVDGGIEGEEPVYFVRDDGVGFDMQYADKLFGAFQRLHSAGEFEGTGIGLANVQRIVHRHGGRVWARSEPERGATFCFTLSNRRERRGLEQDDSARRGQS